MIKRIVMFLFAVAIAVSPAFAQKPVTQGASVTKTATIVAIDAGNHVVTLKAADGAMADVVCGPEVKRFAELKVGDAVTFTYYESIVYAIQQPGAKPPAPDAAAIKRSEGAAPGGTIAHQMTTVVTIKAIDPKVPSVTITTADGNTMSFAVENAKNLAGVKVGDKVQITYTQALAVKVEPAKK